MVRDIKFKANRFGEIFDVLEWNFYSYHKDKQDILLGKNGKPVLRELLKNLDIMQFTGLKDKNGKEIYEGDIVMDRTTYADLWESKGVYENNTTIIPFVVFWCEGEAQFRIKNDAHEIHEAMSGHVLEIIGNIYENSELLIN